MEGQRIILYDGTTIENGMAGYSQGYLWCYFTGYSMSQMAALFLDAFKTNMIVFQYGEKSDEYAGFTNCVLMRTDEDGNNAVCMRKGA